MTGAHWQTITRHLFRRTALARKRAIERDQVAAATENDPEAMAELLALGVTADVQLRVASKRWKGFWRVEQLAR